MLANINWPVKVHLVIPMKSGGTMRLSVLVQDKERQLVEKLFDIATKEQEKADPKQVGLPFDKAKPYGIPHSYQTVDGREMRSSNGVVWDVAQPIPEPQAAVRTTGCRHGRNDCQLTEECNTADCPWYKDDQRKRRDKCQQYPHDCGTVRCLTTNCARKDAGMREREETDASRVAAVESRKRGRPRKAPVAKPVSTEPVERPIAEPSTVKHSGQMCDRRYIHCSTCDDSSCVNRGKSLTYWAHCGQYPDPVRCDVCEQLGCPFRRESPFCLENRCKTSCLNTWCKNYESRFWTEKHSPDDELTEV